MKRVLFYTFLMIGSWAWAQNYNDHVEAKYLRWYFSYENPCDIESSIRFENKTNKTISSITFWFIITEIKTNTVQYRKKHTVAYTLKSQEIFDYPKFNWRFCGMNDYFGDNYNWDVIIISYK